jgi:uncharacterized protein
MNDMPAMPFELEEDYERLCGILRRYESVLVAYSGGVDSGLLAYVAHRVLPGRMLAVLAVSPSLARREESAAVAFLEMHGIPYKRIGTDELEKEAYRRNSPDRCYHCKKELFTRLLDVAQSERYAVIAFGANADDLNDHRPGAVAAKRLGVVSPLVDAGFDKELIRRTARAMKLSLWDKPASPCLASRVPYFERVTARKLAQIEAAEDTLKAQGFPVCRVRHHGSLARIEVPVADQPRLREDSVWRTVHKRLREAGFRDIVVDPEGFRSGRLNDLLKQSRHLGREPVDS